MTLSNDVLRIGEELITAVVNGHTISPFLNSWKAVADRMEASQKAGQLQVKDAQIASAAAKRVEILASSLVELETENTAVVDSLTAELNNILLHDDDSPEPTPKPPLRTSKRSCRPTTRRPPPSRSPSPPPPAHASTTHDPRSLPLRHWFLEHLSFPYPSPSEKISIAADCGITRAKVDSDMTNWRRRSGWTDMMVRYSGGDRETMRVMLEQLLAGKGERVGGVADAADGVRRYLMGEAPKPELGWIEELPVVAGRMPSTTSNPRKRRSSSSEPDSSDSDESEEAYHPLPTQSRARPSAARQMPHIPSISSLSTTSTFINSDGGGKRTVSGSSRYSYATDSTFAEADEELLRKAESTQTSLPMAEQSAFTFTPLYASAYGLQPSTSTPQTTRKRPADAPLGPDSAKTVRRLDPSFYHSSYPSTSAAGPSSVQPTHSYIAARALSPTSSHASHASSVSGGTETSVSSPSSVTDIENNYIPYASFTTSGHILAEASGSGSGSVPRGSAGARGDGQEVVGRMGSWAATAPLARPDWGVSQVRFSLPQGEYEFAPRLEGWVGGH